MRAGRQRQFILGLEKNATCAREGATLKTGGIGRYRDASLGASYVLSYRIELYIVHGRCREGRASQRSRASAPFDSGCAVRSLPSGRLLAGRSENERLLKIEKPFRDTHVMLRFSCLTTFFFLSFFFSLSFFDSTSFRRQCAAAAGSEKSINLLCDYVDNAAAFVLERKFIPVARWYPISGRKLMETATHKHHSLNAFSQCSMLSQRLFSSSLRCCAAQSYSNKFEEIAIS